MKTPRSVFYTTTVHKTNTVRKSISIAIRFYNQKTEKLSTKAVHLVDSFLFLAIRLSHRTYLSSTSSLSNQTTRNHKRCILPLGSLMLVVCLSFVSLSYVSYVLVFYS